MQSNYRAPNALDLVGQRFGRLTVTERLPKRIYGGQPVAFWRCQCECGGEIAVSTGNLRSANTASCGCVRTPPPGPHGNSKHPLYQTWVDIIRRCGDPDN